MRQYSFVEHEIEPIKGKPCWQIHRVEMIALIVIVAGLIVLIPVYLHTDSSIQQTFWPVTTVEPRPIRTILTQTIPGYTVPIPSIWPIGSLTTGSIENVTRELKNCFKLYDDQIAIHSAAVKAVSSSVGINDKLDIVRKLDVIRTIEGDCNSTCQLATLAEIKDAVEKPEIIPQLFVVIITKNGSNMNESIFNLTIDETNIKLPPLEIERIYIVNTTRMPVLSTTTKPRITGIVYQQVPDYSILMPPNLPIGTLTLKSIEDLEIQSRDCFGFTDDYRVSISQANITEQTANTRSFRMKILLIGPSPLVIMVYIRVESMCDLDCQNSYQGRIQSGIEHPVRALKNWMVTVNQPGEAQHSFEIATWPVWEFISTRWPSVNYTSMISAFHSSAYFTSPMTIVTLLKIPVENFTLSVPKHWPDGLLADEKSLRDLEEELKIGLNLEIDDQFVIFGQVRIIANINELIFDRPLPEIHRRIEGPCDVICLNETIEDLTSQSTVEYFGKMMSQFNS